MDRISERNATLAGFFAQSPIRGARVKIEQTIGAPRISTSRFLYDMNAVLGRV